MIMNKNKNKELNVDFIGGQESLTKEEEKKLHVYFQKIKKNKSRSRDKRELVE